MMWASKGRRRGRKGTMVHKTHKIAILAIDVRYTLLSGHCAVCSVGGKRREDLYFTNK